MLIEGTPLPAGLILLWSFVAILFAAIVHISLAMAVYRDSMRFRDSTFLVGPGLWSIATLLGGVVTVAAYWAIHHSTLRGEHGAAR